MMDLEKLLVSFNPKQIKLKLTEESSDPVSFGYWAIKSLWWSPMINSSIKPYWANEMVISSIFIGLFPSCDMVFGLHL